MHMHSLFRRSLGAAIAAGMLGMLGTLGTLGAAACSDSTTSPSTTDVSKLNHIVVIYLENHSFDNMYGEFSGANGLSSATATSAAKQIDLTGTQYATLPVLTSGQPPLLPTTLPNAPFSLDEYVAPTVATQDLVHRFYQEQKQIDGGKMDKFAAVSDSKGCRWATGARETSHLPRSPLTTRFATISSIPRSVVLS